MEMQAEVLELLNSVDTKLDYRSFLAATMEKVHRDTTTSKCLFVGVQSSAVSMLMPS